MKTKGEVLISGLDQIREGLDLIAKLGDSIDLVKEIGVNNFDGGLQK